MPTTSPTSTATPTDLAAALANVTAERDEFKRLYLEMLALNRKHELGLLGGRERVPDDPAQLTISMLDLMTGAATPAPVDEPAPDTQKIPAHERAKPTGRKPLPANLPRIEETIYPPEVLALGLDAFDVLGVDVKETLEYRPSMFLVLRQLFPKFVLKNRDLKNDVPVFQGEPPELPIPRGLAGPSLLADTVVRRWADHLPLHRLERVYGRSGVELPRSTVCDWHAALAKLVQPLLGAMWKDAFEAPFLCIDATGVLVQALEKCRNAHFWVVAAPERHVLFGFSSKHDNAAVDRLLSGYVGFLVADAHTVYDHLFKDGQIREAACWAHVRRYFYKALESEPNRARHAIALISKLFHIEKLIASSPPEARRATRNTDSAAVLATFEAWCDVEVASVLDETPLSKALKYARNHRVALRTFLDDPRVPIHNNWSERELRREAVGRKNWLFVGSDEGGAVNATFVSLIASCQLHGIEPFAYLRDLFCLLPGWKLQDVLELSPMKWAATVARPDVQKALAENIFRRASLAS